MKTQLTVLLSILLFPLALYSQDYTSHCGHTELQAQLQAEDATVADKRDAFEMKYLDFVNAKRSITSLDSVTLPVVIHVVHYLEHQLEKKKTLRKKTLNLDWIGSTMYLLG